MRVLPLCGLLAVLPLRAAEPLPLPPARDLESAGQESPRDLYRRVTGFAQSGDFQKAFRLVEAFGARTGHEDPFYHELQGTLLAMQKQYPAAQAAFERVLARAPDSHVGRFNRAEMIMLQARYEEAEQAFLAVEEQTSGQDPAVADLCRFKRVLCLLSAGRTPAAELLVPPAREDAESPAVTFARATLEFAKHRPAAALALLEEARTRFSPGVENLYTDTLVELRWGQRDDTGRFFFKPRLR